MRAFMAASKFSDFPDRKSAGCEHIERTIYVMLGDSDSSRHTFEPHAWNLFTSSNYKFVWLKFL